MSQMPEPDPPAAAVAAQPAAFGVGTALVLVFGGVILGLFGGFLQAWSVSVAGIAVPIGWVLVIATLLASIRALIHAFDKRRAGVVFFLGGSSPVCCWRCRPPVGTSSSLPTGSPSRTWPSG